MIYTVTFNPSIDCVYTLNEFHPGTTNRASEENYYPGGKGLNVSLVLHTLGVPTTALGFLAGGIGRAIAGMLEQTGCPTDFIQMEKGSSRINTKLCAKTESEINGLGPTPSPAALELLIDKIRMLSPGDMLVLSGSIPAALPSNTYQYLIQQLSSRDIQVAVDASGDLLRLALPERPFFIKPNLSELSGLFSTPLHTIDEICQAAQYLQQLGARNVLVSMGASGALLLTEDHHIYTQSIVPGQVISTVGAGDAMVAGFLSGFRETGDYLHALRLGSACGNATAFSHHLADAQQIQKIYNRLPETKEMV